VQWVVFPHYEREGGTQVTALSAAEGLRRLMDKALVLPELLDRQGVERLVEWVRDLEFYDLRLASLADAVRAIAHIVEGARDPHEAPGP
jgi:hypothetical protein